MTNLAGKLTAAAGGYAARPAIRLDETVLSYAELHDASARPRHAAHNQPQATLYQNPANQGQSRGRRGQSKLPGCS